MLYILKSFIYQTNKKINIKFILIILISFINIIINIELRQKIDLNNLKNYYILNNQGILKNKKKKFKKNLEPKISIICSLFNGEQYILRFLRSIQNQFFENIEIIFIDDCSTDNSSKVIMGLQREDDRIILIKLKRNKGTFIARNIGVLMSKGEFIIIPDIDDILSQNIMKKCYDMTKKNNYDLIRFNMYSDKEFVFNRINKDLKNPIYQPELKNILIYGLGYKKLIDGIISNKFIKREIYIKAINNIKKYYIDKYMPYFEDGLINFSLHRHAQSLYLLKRLGYFYIFNKNSISHSLNNNKYFKCLFIFLRFIFEYSKNNKYEKDMVYFLLDEYIPKNEILYELTEYSDVYEEVINILIDSEYCNIKYKNKLLIMKEIILNNNIKYKK